MKFQLQRAHMNTPFLSKCWLPDNCCWKMTVGWGHPECLQWEHQETIYILYIIYAKAWKIFWGAWWGMWKLYYRHEPTDNRIGSWHVETILKQSLCLTPPKYLCWISSFHSKLSYFARKYRHPAAQSRNETYSGQILSNNVHPQKSVQKDRLYHVTLWRMVKRPFQTLKWPPTRGSRGHKLNHLL